MYKDALGMMTRTTAGHGELPGSPTQVSRPGVCYVKAASIMPTSSVHPAPAVQAVRTVP